MESRNTTWNLPAPRGFQGLRDDLPLGFYERHLPHWRQDGATYFTTFRLVDSLPVEVLDLLVRQRIDWERRNPVPRSPSQLEELARITFELVERSLDAGIGECVLRDPQNAMEICESMQHFDGNRYELGCYVVMPNHVHAIVRPLVPEKYSLEDILGGWKGYSAQQINRRLGRRLALWQSESYDRIIRDEEHLWRAVQYIGRNPGKANLPDGQFQLWMSPEWESQGWYFVGRASGPSGKKGEEPAGG